jgi:hypothetical protein
MMQRAASGAWLDADFEEGDDVVEIKMGSDAYFTLLRVYPQAMAFAQLGSDVTFKLGTGYVRIGADGLEHASAEELRLIVGEIPDE